MLSESASKYTMKKLSIRTRVFTLALTPTLLISIVLGTFLISSRIHDLELEQHTNAVTFLNHIINISRNGLLKNDKHELQAIIDILPDERELQSITFYNKNHEILAYGGAEDPQETSENIIFNNEQPTAIEKADTLTLTAPIIIDDLKLYSDMDYSHSAIHPAHKEIIGWVAITFSKTKTILEEYQVIIFTLILLSLGIAISTFFAIRTSHFFTKPLQIIRDGIKKLAHGDFDTRIHTDTYGEINELEEDINKMAASLQQNRQELQDNANQTTAHLKQSLITIESQNMELARAQKEAHEASRIKSEFISNMSHEIRTPMNSIVGYTNLLLETDLSILQRNYLTTIQKSTLNLLNLINNILDFSKLDAGQLKLDFILFDIYDCLEEVITIMSPLANSKQLEFAALVDKDVPRKILSDPLRIKQIMINLISNAIKFTDEGEIVIHISLDKKTNRSNKFRITISDTGIGMSAQEQKSIFRAFQQADSSIARKYGGTGLGLAICKKLVDQMDGKIGVDSHQDKGSTFWFTFTSEKTLHDHQHEPNAVNFMGYRIFLCEPHPVSRQSLINTLEEWQAHVVEFSEFETLISELQQSSDHTQIPSVIILGINQHYAQNDEAAHTLYQLKKYFSGPVIVLTNSPEQATLDYFLQHGACASLAKPVLRNNLYHALFQLLLSTKDERLKTDDKFIIHPAEILPDLNDKHILCVDDNPQNANLIKALLENTHAIITVAHDGLEAFQLCKQHSYHLILMDIRMPKMDGYEALKMIRSTENQNKHTPVIAISAHISDGEHQDLLDTGFNGYLIKPVVKFTLIETIKQWIMKTQNKTYTTHKTYLENVDDKHAIDWQLAVKLAGNKEEFAKEMLSILIKSLNQDISDIKSSLTKQEYSELLRRIHKLHGALCYCGVPRLKAAAAELEAALKRHDLNNIPILFNVLEIEANHVIEEAAAIIQ